MASGCFCPTWSIQYALCAGMKRCGMRPISSGKDLFTTCANSRWLIVPKGIVGIEGHDRCL
eukprot:12910350-Prorocentrum_lima.AAC.1